MYYTYRNLLTTIVVDSLSLFQVVFIISVAIRFAIPISNILLLSIYNLISNIILYKIQFHIYLTFEYLFLVNNQIAHG